MGWPARQAYARMEGNAGRIIPDFLFFYLKFF